MQRYDIYCGHDMIPYQEDSDVGDWVWHEEAQDALAAARAENERLTKERDEARAQVAAAYACGWKDGNHPDADQMPTDAQSALEAYGREKVREGMQRAYELSGQYHQITHIRAAILADMETLK